MFQRITSSYTKVLKLPVVPEIFLEYNPEILPEIIVLVFFQRHKFFVCPSIFVLIAYLLHFPPFCGPDIL